MDIDSMKISLTIRPDNIHKNVDVKKGTIVIDLIRSLNLSPDALIVLKNNQPIPIDEELATDEPLDVLKVASGG